MGSIHLISGDDAPRIAETARKVVDKLTGGNDDPFSFDLIQDQESVAPENALITCINSIQTPSFLGGDKTVWLKDCASFDKDRGATGVKADEPVSKAFEKLTALISGPFPADIHLVISGLDVNKKMRFYKACGEHATVKILEKPDLNNRNWRSQVQALVRTAATDHGLTLDHATHEYLVEAIGVDTGRIPMEMEKLICYAGANPTLADARTVCTGNREAVFYALNNALGDRDLTAAFAAIDQLITHAPDEDRAALSMVRQAGTFFGGLLDVRLFMQNLQLKTPEALKRLLEDKTDKRLAEYAASPIASMHAYRAMMLAQQARNYRGPELVAALSILADAGKRMVSTNLPKRFVLEHMVATIIARPPGERG